ncbi:MAG: hypothetical protein AAFN07_04670 [Pseudomonadota bacterium]
MKTIGLYLMIAGAGSIALNQFGYEFSLLMWIDNWGPTVGWAIRGGAIVLGAALFFFGKEESEPESA